MAVVALLAKNGVMMKTDRLRRMKTQTSRIKLGETKVEAAIMMIAHKEVEGRRARETRQADNGRREDVKQNWPEGSR